MPWSNRNQCPLPCIQHSCAGLLLIVSTLFVACGGSPSDTGDNGPKPNDETAGPYTSKLGNYEATVTPPGNRLPFNDYADLTVTLRGAESGEPINEADLTAQAYVDKFDSPMPTDPIIEPLDKGQYQIRGLLLHIPRRWQLDIKIGGEVPADQVTIPLDPVASLPAPKHPPTDRFTDRQLKRVLSFSPEDKSLPASPSNNYADDPAAAHLGQFLFFDEKLSANDQVACATCHQPSKGFGDGQKLSTGVGQTTRHAPTVLNSAYNRWFFWDGRADSLWSQALQPLEAPNEHGFDRLRVLRRIAGNDQLRKAYRQVFGPLPELSGLPQKDTRPVPGNSDAKPHQRWMEIASNRRRAISAAYANVGKAIAAYERKLIRNNAPFDRYVTGLRTGNQQKLGAISEQAKRGLKLFVTNAACDLCHAGHQFTNFQFHTLGLGTRSWLPADDRGRASGLAKVKQEEFNAVGRYSDASKLPPRHKFAPEQRFALEGAFKTPTLRNLTATAPYMHGGHHETLEDVVEFYSDLQKMTPVGRRDAMLQPLELSDSQVDALVAFLKTLTGEPLPESLKEQPDSPVPPDKPEK